MEALLGHGEEGVRLSRRAVELLPYTRDTLDGPNVSFDLAEVYAWTGDKERALEELARLLRIPCRADVFTMQHDPMFAPLRGDPRFEALINDPKNRATLF
jgi:hypothetical protein